MKILKFEVGGYRSLKGLSWRPGDLNVVRGAASLDLFRAARLHARVAGGWNTFPDAMRVEGAADAAFWTPEAIEARWFLLTAPPPTGDLQFGHEMIVERLEGPPWWVVGYERTTLSNDFDVHDVAERVGSRVELNVMPKPKRGVPTPKRPKTEVARIANDMTTLGALHGLRGDPRVEAHIDAVAAGSFLHEVASGEGSPMRAASAPVGFHGALRADGSNLVNVLHNVADWHDARRRFERAMREVHPGFDGLRFRSLPEGGVAMALATRDGRSTPAPELPAALLRTMALLGALASPEPPSVLWWHEPDAGVLPWALATVAELALDAARRFQVVLSEPSAALEARLRDLALAPGRTARGGPLKVAFFDDAALAKAP